MEEAIRSNEAQLAKCIARYEELLTKGEDAISDRDKKIFGDDITGVLAGSVSHISSCKRLIMIVKAMLEGVERRGEDLRQKRRAC